MANDFPNIKAMGLCIHMDAENEWVVSADEIEEALSEAPEVWGAPERYKQNTAWFVTEQVGDEKSHTARLVCIQPIVKETVKKEITREDLWNELQNFMGNRQFQEIAKRLGL